MSPENAITSEEILESAGSEVVDVIRDTQSRHLESRRDECVQDRWDRVDKKKMFKYTKRIIFRSGEWLYQIHPDNTINNNMIIKLG